MVESKLPYDVRKEGDVLNKVVKMEERRKELKELIVDVATKICYVQSELKDVRNKLKQFVKQYDAETKDDVAKNIADLSVIAKRYRSEVRTFSRDLRQYVKDLRTLGGTEDAK
jgi:DNA repair ATPase RecN